MPAASEPERAAGRPEDPIFGETARRLAPRALYIGTPYGAPYGAEALDRLRALPAPLAGKLAAAHGLHLAALAVDGRSLDGAQGNDTLYMDDRGRFVPFSPPDGAPAEGQVTLWCDPRALSERAAEAPDFAALSAAIQNRSTPPAPPVLMGVVNVTPDSFSDGGRFRDPSRAIEHAHELVEQGAAILDIGGESTRPGATPVETKEELARVLPVLEGLAGETAARLSIDTTKAEVASQALAAGAEIVNDISAGDHDERMWGVVAEAGCEYVVMHRQGDPATMQIAPSYTDPVAEVCEWLRNRVHRCLLAGIEANKIVLDPGIGFGKRLRHNVALLHRLPELRSLGCPMLLGVSRKSFIAHLTGAEKQKDFRGQTRQDRPMDRVGGTAAALFACIQGGAEILRVHDVRIMSEALQVARALTNPATVHFPD